MPKAMRALVLASLISIAYIATSVYFYGKDRISDHRHPLSQDYFVLLWLPLVAVNTWAIASAMTPGNSVPAKLLLAIIGAIIISVAAMVVSMTIAFNAYGT